MNQIGLGNVWAKTLNQHLAIVKQRLEDIERQTWQGEMNNDTKKDKRQKNKLRTLRTFKLNYAFEGYLNQVSNIKHRIQLTKLRLSNHKLEIETGRYSKPYKKPEERLCTICKENTEDEQHFLMDCPAYKKDRSELYHFIEQESNMKIYKMTPKEIFFLLINTPEKYKKIQQECAKFIYKCTIRRQHISIMSLLQLDGLAII